MKRSNTRILFAASILIFSLLLSGCQDQQKKGEVGLESAARDGKQKTADSREISIQNGTNDLMYYTIQPEGSMEYPYDRILDVGEIYTYAGGEALNVTYRRSDSIERKRLEPGTIYSFIQDDQGEVTIKEGWHGVEYSENLAPFLATPMEIVLKMLEIAQITEDDIVYDLGCGDGRIVIAAAKNYGARGVGIDFNPKRIEESLERAEKEGVEHLVTFKIGDVLKADFSEATVVSTYLLTRSNARLRPLFEKQLKRGTRVVTHNYRVPGWEDREIDSQMVELGPANVHWIYLYKR
jgi:SAM-dependent methyltransferase